MLRRISKTCQCDIEVNEPAQVETYVAAAP